MTPHLQGLRVHLRAAVTADVEARFALGRDAGILEMFGVSRDEFTPLTRDDAARWVERLIAHPCAWVIEHDGRLIGEVRLDNINHEDRRASFAIGIYDVALLGKGLGTEAARLVLAHAFRDLNLHRISLRVLAHNARAICSYQKCRFVIEGRERQAAYVNGQWHDDIIMGLLVHEFGTGSA